MTSARVATAFAPASVANVAVGFDILGFAFGKVGDLVTVTRLESEDTPKIRMGAMESATSLPESAERNCAGAALIAMHEDLNLEMGLEISLRKGIPLSSGMGGSAASAVGAVVAANALLDEPLPWERLLTYALAGERVASGDAHADNVAPCLRGGLTAALPGDPFRVMDLPIPKGLHCLIVKPDVQLDTRGQRSKLASELSLRMHVQQSAHLAGFVAACYENDLELLSRSMCDLVVEPQRCSSIPAYAELQRAAHRNEAIAFGIAGSGPSVFAWLRTLEAAQALEAEMLQVLSQHKLSARAWMDELGSAPAKVVAAK
ncbi:MAG: homoserine kinase [Planctomycetota bacterium]|jgi:homoserine kinase